MSGTNSAAHNFPVPAGTTLLRVAFSGIASSSGSVDTNYYLRASATATTIDFDCAGTGTVGFCQISDPIADVWHTLVNQTLYQGEYQVTVTLFGPPAAVAAPAVPSLDSSTRRLLVGAMACL
ncbi:MAG: hypothetical protein H8E78_02625, partial [Proteobacteria bacterium]|nr:hypothetical protein [Pseudomonadota bacterium]